MSNIQLFKGDCIEQLKNIKDGEVDLFLLDLPYGQTNNKWDVEINLEKMWKEILRTANKKGINIIFFCTTKFGFKLIQSKPSLFCYDLVWEKTSAQGFLSCNKLPLRAHEMIYIFKTRPETEKVYNKNQVLRDYARKLKEEVIKESLATINKKLYSKNNKIKYPMEHFLGSYRGSAYQFSVPLEESYKILTELYGLEKLDYYLTYDEMKNLQEKKEKKEKQNIKTYNPQFEKGKPYQIKKTQTTITNYGVKTRKKTNNNGFRYPRSVLKFSNNSEKEKIHSTQKPVDLLEYLIKTYSNKGDTVCDFTMGSGSTGVACINTERNFIGIELDEYFFNKAEERINKTKFSYVNNYQGL